jgi:hypothetical protein
MVTLADIKRQCPLFFKKDQEIHTGTFKYSKRGDVVFTHNQKADLNNGEVFIKAWLFHGGRLHHINAENETYISPDGSNTGYQRVKVSLETGKISQYLSE